MSDTELTTLIAKPPRWQGIQRWPGAFLLGAGLWSGLFAQDPAALLFLALGFWGTAEFWRGIRVTGDRLVAQGRLRRRTIPLADVLQVGHSPSRTVWVQVRGMRTIALHMAETRIDESGGLSEIHDRLRELAAEAGATLDPPLEEPRQPPRPSTPFFGW